VAICVTVAAALAADTVIVEQIIAKINGDIITKSDLDRERRTVEMQLRQRGMTPQQVAEAMKEQEKNILRSRIDNLLLVQRGKEMNINVDSEVTKYLGQIQADSKIAEPEKFQQYIREQTGMSYEDFRQETRNGILTQRVIGQEVSSKVNVTRAEIEDYYTKNKEKFVREEQVFLREILISTQDKDAAGVAAAEKKARDIVARARKGERFADLVRDNSDAQTAKEGGSLGSWKKGDLSEAIVKAIWDKARGYVADPIKVPAGFEIIRVDEHFKEGQATLAEVENEIKERIYMPRMEPKVREFLTELRMNAFLEIRDGFQDSGAAPGKDTSWTDPAVLKPETVSKEEVSANTRMKRLLFMIPIPGTKAIGTGKSSSK
jgi:parvulin-like peptidyl-prolyl isomerase